MADGDLAKYELEIRLVVTNTSRYNAKYSVLNALDKMFEQVEVVSVERKIE